MVLLRARTRTPWLALGLFVVLLLMGLVAAIPRTSIKGAGMVNLTVVSPGGAASTDDDEIRRLIAKYAQSVDEADTTLASQVWSDSPEVSFIHPLGHEHGFEQIKQNVYERLMGITFSERKLTIHDLAVHVYGDAAWAEFYWDFSAKFRKDGSPLSTHGRETQVYRKMQNGWRLVHVHYSGMPPAEKPAGF